jgi:hypothetical protein
LRDETRDACVGAWHRCDDKEHCRVTTGARCGNFTACVLEEKTASWWVWVALLCRDVNDATQRYDA